MECCLELLERDLLVALQDLGAAGLTSAGGEMAAKGGVGIEVDVAKVPLREADIEPFEVMVSESQERMLAWSRRSGSTRCARSARVADRGRRDRRGDRGANRSRPRRRDVGRPTMPVEALVDGCPLYDLEPAEPDGWMYGNEGELTVATRQATCSSRCSPRRRSRASVGPSSSTTRSSARAPSVGPATPTRRCSRSARPASRSPSRSTATAAESPAIPTAAPSRPCSSAPRTSPAPARSRSG